MTTKSDDAPKPETILERLARTLGGAIGKGQGEALEALRAWRREHSREARDRMTEALRAALGKHLTRNAAKLEEKTLNVLRQWANEEANPEALVEWLERGGWESIAADKVEPRLVKAAQAARPVPQEGMTSFVWLGREEPALLIYDVTAADNPFGNAESFNQKPEAGTIEWRILRGVAHYSGAAFALRKPDPDYSALEALGLPDATMAQLLASEEPPAISAVILMGHAALRAGLRAHDWPTLSLIAEPADKAADWLGLLAGAWLKDRLPRAEREASAVAIELRPKATTEAGAAWTAIPRALDIASALGGPLSVDVNGEAYAHEPSLAPEAVGRALRPQGVDVVPAEWLGNPAQLSLALDLDAPPEAVREYLVETATRTATLAELPRMVPKLLGFMFAAAPMTKRPVKGTLLDLARWLYPEWATGEGPTVKPWKDRRQGPRDLKAIGAAFVAIKSLRLVETKPDGVRHPYDLFVVDYDLSAKPDAQVGFMLNPFLADRMKGGRGGGFFLLNMTRWLALGTKNPRLFALALRLAALWDGARDGGVFNPDRLRPIGADRLAYLCNTLPEGAAMYSTGRTKAHAGKVALLNARANLEADLDALREAGLVGDWKPTMQRVHGKGWNLVPVPPEDYAEACKRAVNAAKAARKRGANRGS